MSHRHLFTLLIAATFLLGCGSAEPPDQSGGELLSMVRDDHPRLFVNRDILPVVKEYALSEEKQLFDSLRAVTDALIDSSAGSVEVADHGNRAAVAGFIYLITGERKYFEITREMLERSLEYYHQRYRNNQEVSWYSDSRINAWAAFDWIFNDLTKDERKSLGQSFVRAVAQVQPTDQREPFARENWLGPVSGFYGTPGLLWYAGLALHGEGIADSLAASWIERGDELYTRLLEFRSGNAGDDGGSASAALNYTLTSYPWAEFNYFHTYISATGVDIAASWPYIALLPGYVYWNWLPGVRDFGWGDSYHWNNKIRTYALHMHLSQILHFYAASMPRESAFAYWMRERVRRDDRLQFILHRFLVTNRPQGIESASPPEKLPLARHFENMGQTFFRSGSGPDDTYAQFASGGVLEMHKHFDDNNFTIYKKGFLALDTGNRSEPGIHLSHYFSRTVAHNAVTIRMPGEQLTRYWHHLAPGEEELPIPNDGGQRVRGGGSEVVAFESGEHYAYAAGDATGSYHPDKAALVLRQFVFVPPDYFVVFDRVESKDPAYEKRWLLHTADKPEITGLSFSADHEQGRLFCRTVYPADADLKLVGGEGKRFWNDGRNWDFPPRYEARVDTSSLIGRWRVEIRPPAPSQQDFFLHLLQAADQSVGRMVDAELVESGEGGMLGVEFALDGLNRSCRVEFATVGNAAGRIVIREGETTLVDKPLSESVQPQQGLFGN